jgi:hypothetical protein
MYRSRTRLFLTAAAVLACGAVPLAQEPARAAAAPVPRDLICGPQATLSAPDQGLRIVGGAEPVKALFAAGETVLVNAGTEQGVTAGAQYLVRRVVDDRFTVRTVETSPLSIHTAGWITIVEARADVSLATVSVSCDGIAQGDYLEPFALPVTAAPLPPGQPDYDRPARVVLADERRQMGTGGGSLMVIDRGSDHGLRPGQRLTIFRRTLDGAGPALSIGEAFVAVAGTETSVMRIQTARDAIAVGDLIAIHR